MGILTNIMTAYQGWQQYKQGQKKEAIDNAKNLAALHEMIQPGQPINDQNTLQALKQAGIDIPAGQGGQLQPLKLPGERFQVYDPTSGKMGPVQEAQPGAKLIQGKQGKLTEYINPQTKQSAWLPEGQSPPPQSGYVSKDVYNQQMLSDRQTKALTSIADRQDKSIRAMNDRPAKPTFQQQVALNAAERKKGSQLTDDEKNNVLNEQKAGGPLVGVIPNPNPNLTGWDALKNYEPAIQSKARGLVEGRLPYPGAFALKDPQWKAAIQAAQDVDPSYDAKTYPLRMATLKSFTSGKDAQNKTSINTLVGHLASLKKSADALDNKGFRYWNKLGNWIKSEAGNPKLTRFNMDLGAVESELAAVFKGTGATDQEIKAWRERINSSDSPEQLQTAIHEAVELMGSRLQALKEKYEAGMGPYNKPINILSPKARSILGKLVGQDAVDALEPKQTQTNSSPGIYKYTATGKDGHKIGSNDGNTWVDMTTGQPIGQ